MAILATEFRPSSNRMVVQESRGASFYARRGKRLLDVAASLGGLTISIPLLLFCALLVRLTSRGPYLSAKLVWDI